MMDELFTWSLKSSAILVVLFACYYFLFRHNTAFKLRRTLLLAILCLSCIAPLLQFEVSEQNPVIIQKVMEIKSATKIEIDPAKSSRHIEAALPFEQTADSFYWKALILKIYIVGILISLGFLIFEISKVIYLQITSTTDHSLGRNVFKHAKVSTPFSFYRWIFIPQDAAYDASTWKIIQQHEQTHINKKHSLDILCARLFQSVLWFNPIIYLIHKEIRAVHEAQADASVLEKTGFSTYAQTLMQVSMPGYQIPIGHSFAVISSLSKRLKLMKTHKSKLRKTLTLLSIFTVVAFGILGWSALKGQNDRVPNYDAGRAPIKVNSREEAFELVKSQQSIIPVLMFNNQLPSRFKTIKLKLQSIYGDKEIKFRYLNSPANFDYLGNRTSDTPLYFGQLRKEDKEEIYDLALRDTARINSIKFPSHTEPQYLFDIRDFVKYSRERLDIGANYIVFYEPNFDKIPDIVDESEVDILPEPMGGIEAFTRAVALDMELPTSLRKEDLPEFIEYSAVISGGTQISNINLLTELKGSENKNKEAYLFFGDVMSEILDKTRKFYAWKRGVKDGKDVRVRMKISIPTKYMM